MNGTRKTCGECADWDVIPQDVSAGKCKANPPSVFGSVVPGPMGQPSIAVQTLYPMTQRDEKACRHFVARGPLLQ